MMMNAPNMQISRVSPLSVNLFGEHDRRQRRPQHHDQDDDFSFGPSPPSAPGPHQPNPPFDGFGDFGAGRGNRPVDVDEEFADFGDTPRRPPQHQDEHEDFGGFEDGPGLGRGQRGHPSPGGEEEDEYGFGDRVGHAGDAARKPVDEDEADFGGFAVETTTRRDENVAFNSPDFFDSLEREEKRYSDAEYLTKF